MEDKTLEKIARELELIKKLIMFSMITNGTKAKDIAKIFGVDPAVITRLVPTRKVSKK